MALNRLLDLLAYQCLRFSSIFLCFSYSYVQHTKLVSSLVNFWAHNNIVFDMILIWYIISTVQCSQLSQ